ncbi:MAG: hypothetical protein JXD19_12650 [Deltaproteobacteria bacterium]|nr:hypothetical protein [Deltaproteobacteria bacterium]
MKQYRLPFFLAIIVCLSIFTTTDPASSADWTFMVYVDGDNNLEGAGLADINEMEMVGSSPGVNVLVQFDRIEGYDSSDGDWYDTRRGRIIKDSSSAILSDLVSVGEKNMGDPDTLRQFVVWGMTQFPANHYALVLWNHGDGWFSRLTDYQQELNNIEALIRETGVTPFLKSQRTLLNKKIEEATKSICWDSTDGGDALTIKECRQALEGLPAAIDIIGFDACLMGMVEVAFEVRDVADVMVSSQDLEPTDGWPYDGILEGLTTVPGMTAAALAELIVTSYRDAYGGVESQSAVYMDKISELTDCLDLLVAILTTDPVDFDAITVARNSARSFHDQDYRDLGAFLEGLAVASESAEVRGEATQCLSALRSAVFSNHPGAADGVQGLSIHLIDVGGDFPSGYNDVNLRFADRTLWDEFLGILSEHEVFDDDYEDNDSSTRAWYLAAGEYQSLICKDEDWFRVQCPLDAPFLGAISFNHAAGDLDMKLYDSELVLVDSSESTTNREAVYASVGTAAEYYIKVYGYGEATNNYTLSLSSPETGSTYRVETVPFHWIDATTGTYLDMEDDDYTTVELGFSFQFYDVEFSSVKVSSNGYLTFGYMGDAYSNQPIPLAGEPSNLIAPFWDDLAPNNGNGVFFTVIGTPPERKCVIQWDHVPHYSTSDGVTFEVLISEADNDITFQYQDVVFNDPALDLGLSATVGLEDGSGKRGTLFSYKKASLSQNSALRFYTPPAPVSITRLRINSPSAIIPHQAVTITADTVSSGSAILYEFWISEGYASSHHGTSWNRLQDFSSDASCTCYPPAQGNYMVVAYAADDQSSLSSHQASAGVSIPVGLTPTRPYITSLEVQTSGQIVSREEIPIIAQATGGLLPPVYQFWVSRSDIEGTSWNLLQDYSSSGTCLWTPQEAGCYRVYVLVSEPFTNAPEQPQSAGLTIGVR